MNKIHYFWILFCITLIHCSASAQEPDTLPKSGWSHNIEGWFYIMQDDFIFSPVYAVDNNWLHLEARYNYEDMNTFSAWFGYNFNGGNKFQYTITPMTGALLGNVRGIAPGLELDLEFFGFEISSESEYVFDVQGKENDYFYNWTDFTYTPIDYLWLGLSYQRTKLYQSRSEFQYGPMLGGGYKWFGFTGYFYNPFSDDPYFVLYLSITIPE